MSARKRPLIAGNWKMHNTIMESLELVDALVKRLDIEGVTEVDVLVCPPFTALESVSNRLAGTQKVLLGAQNCAQQRQGAFTGETSPLMLLDVGCKYVILGHSERRAIFGETNELVNAKLKLTLECGLGPIVCVGETLDERENGSTFNVLETQVRGCLAGIRPEKMAEVTLAYEPVWAIGTGRTATPETAEEAHRFIRQIVDSMANDAIATSMRKLYGGSVKPGNASDLFREPDIDGALVGGASLDAESFFGIISSARS